MAKKPKQNKHSKLLTWFFKTISILIILIVGIVVIYNIMPNSQKKIINNATNNQARQVNKQVPKTPADFQSALQDLRHNQLITMENVKINEHGDVQGQIQGTTLHTHLAGIKMLNNDSIFYRQNYKQFQDALHRVVYPKNAHYSIKSAKHHQIYLFINGKMLQQTWLENGLGYITVPSGYDMESSTLYTAQENAQSNHKNIWSINGAIIPNGNHGYKLDQKNEKDDLYNHPSKFSKQNSGTDFWGKLKKTFR